MAKKRLHRRFTEKDFQREKLKVLKTLDEVTLFDDNDDAARMARCENDFWEFSHTYLPHYFSAIKQAEWHPEMVDALQIREEVIDIAAPRGFSKSTIVSFAFILWEALYQRRQFIVLNMETEPKATMQTWRILLELQYNSRIQHDFGMTVSEDAGRGDFTTLVNERRQHPTRILAFGAGMSARGLINAQFRPDLWINDDLESRSLARNPRRVEALEDVVLADNLGAMCATGWTFLIIGTIICRGSFLDRCQKNAAFKSLKFRAIEDKGTPNERSTWPELHPLGILHALEKSMGSVRFMAEKQNEPMEVGGVFQETWFRFIKTLPAGFDMGQLISQTDPSYSDVGDNKASYIGGNYEHTIDRRDFGQLRDTQGRVIGEGLYTIVMFPFNRKCSIDELILELYRREELYKPAKMKMDGTYGQKKIYQRELARYALVKKKNLPITFTDQARNKQEKILALEPDLRNTILWLYDDSKDMEETIIQFTRYGNPGVNDDGPDCIAELLESLRRLKKKAKVTYV